MDQLVDRFQGRNLRRRLVGKYKPVNEEQLKINFIHSYSFGEEVLLT